MGLLDGIRAAIAAGREKVEQITRQRMTEEVADFLGSAVGGQANLDVLIDARMPLFEAVPVIFRTREGAGWLKHKNIAIDISQDADIRQQIVEKARGHALCNYLLSADTDTTVDGLGVIVEEAGFRAPEWYLRMCLEDFRKALES